MKIGILTYHAACNFGANLQVLSTVGDQALVSKAHSFIFNRGFYTLSYT